MQSIQLPSQRGRIFVVGAGKATFGMAVALHKRLGKKIVGGYVNVPVVYKNKIGKIIVQPATHPFPNSATVAATKKIYTLVQSLTKDDLLICLWSGGGSSLFTLPRPGLALPTQIDLTKKLMRAGANIFELNTVRKHLSQVKGGQLAAATPAKVLSFIISDVIGDRFDVIASGPTVADRSTRSQAKAILKKYHLFTKQLSLIIDQSETPKRLDHKRISTQLVEIRL